MKLIKKLFYKKDEINSSYGREWRTIPIITLKPTLIVGIETQLTKWENKEITPRPISGYYFRIEFNPKNWRIETNHIYYDGPHCIWQLGPFIYSKENIGSCKKCENNN